MQAFEFGLQLSKANVLSGGVRVEFNSSAPRTRTTCSSSAPTAPGAIYHFDEQPSGAVSSKTLSLSAGRWRLFCSLPGHEAPG